MRIVVSDTSPIRALNHLGLMPLLHSLYENVHVPPAVQRELQKAGQRFAALDVSTFPFILITAPHDQAKVMALRPKLDPGE